MELRPIPAERLAANWIIVAPLIDRAAADSRGRFVPLDIVRAVMRREWQLWAAVEGDEAFAAMLTRIVVYPQLKSCELIACIGRRRREWQHFMPEIERWARAEGCALIESHARQGWQRVLKPMGFTPNGHVGLEKRL